MDELEISGKRYISTRIAAKEHKYHSDYIGQLIRGGKVEGQKVGRSWYVAADSLAEYLNNEGGPKPKPQVKEVPKIVAKVITPVEKIEEPILENAEEIHGVEIEEAVEEEAPVILKAVIEETPKENNASENTITLRKPEPVREIPAIKTKTSLRYIADEGPLFPREHHPVPQIKIRPMRVEEPTVVEETVYIEEEPVVIIEKPQAKKTNWIVRGAAVLVLSGVIVGAVTLASGLLVSTTTIEGDTASVTYSFGGM